MILQHKGTAKDSSWACICHIIIFSGTEHVRPCSSINYRLPIELLLGTHVQGSSVTDQDGRAGTVLSGADCLSERPNDKCPCESGHTASPAGITRAQHRRVAINVASSTASCTTGPTNQPSRTFQRLPFEDKPR